MSEVEIDAAELVTTLEDVVARVAENAADCTASMTELGKEGAVAQAALIASNLPPALSPRYAKRKAQLGKGGEPNLVFSGAMRGSITSNPGPQGVEIGPDDPKARFHASLEPRSKIPLRDFVSLSEAFADRAAELVADDVVRELA